MTRYAWVLLCMSGISCGQVYPVPRLPWCEVVDFDETHVVCITPHGRLLTVPMPQEVPVLEAKLQDTIPAKPNCGDGMNYCTDHSMTLVAPIVINPKLQGDDHKGEHPAGDGCNWCDDNGWCTAMYCGKLPAGVPQPDPEPVDVPAIQEKHLHQCTHHERVCAVIPEAESPECPCDQWEDVPYWTCADKSRGLWETLDDHHWCRKAQPWTH